MFVYKCSQGKHGILDNNGTMLYFNNDWRHFCVQCFYELCGASEVNLENDEQEKE